MSDKSKLPRNGSKNPVEGVIRCSCGEVATVHRPRGKRSRFLYTICPQCGTDQRTGNPVQEWIKNNMAEGVESLSQQVVEPKPEPIGLQAEPEAETVTEPKANLTETVTEPETETKPKTDPKPAPEKNSKGALMALCLSIVLGLMGAVTSKPKTEANT